MFFFLGCLVSQSSIFSGYITHQLPPHILQFGTRLQIFFASSLGQDTLDSSWKKSCTTWDLYINLCLGKKISVKIWDVYRISCLDGFVNHQQYHVYNPNGCRYKIAESRKVPVDLNSMRQCLAEGHVRARQTRPRHKYECLWSLGDREI